PAGRHLQHEVASVEPSGGWLTHLKVITVRVGDLRATHGTANGCDWTGRNASLSEAGQERVEVIDKERVQRRPGAVCVGELYIQPVSVSRQAASSSFGIRSGGRPMSRSYQPAAASRWATGMPAKT